jgi:hypothetical protein
MRKKATRAMMTRSRPFIEIECFLSGFHDC